MRRLLLACLLAAHAWSAARAGDTLVLWDFDNNTVGPMESIQAAEPLSRILPQALLARLTRYPDVRIVERVKLREVLEEQKLGASALADQDTRLRLGKILGASGMIFGEYIVLGGVVRSDIRVVDVETSEIILSEPVIGEESEVVEATEAFAEKIAARFSQHQATAQGSSFPVEAWTLYAEGLKQMDAKAYEAAIEIFKQLLSAHPGFALAERQIVLALERLSRGS